MPSLTAKMIAASARHKKRETQRRRAKKKNPLCATGDG
jgi:hypothetical protein